MQKKTEISFFKKIKNMICKIIFFWKKPQKKDNETDDIYPMW